MALEVQAAAEQSTVLDSDLVPGGDKETWYRIRHLTQQKNREVIREHTKQVPNRRTHQRDDVTDWDAVGDALFDYILIEWSGVVQNGQPLGVDQVVPLSAETGETGKAKFLLDYARRSALLERAGYNEVTTPAAAERRSESFRPPAHVR